MITEFGMDGGHTGRSCHANFSWGYGRVCGNSLGLFGVFAGFIGVYLAQFSGFLTRFFYDNGLWCHRGIYRTAVSCDFSWGYGRVMRIFLGVTGGYAVFFWGYLGVLLVYLAQFLGFLTRFFTITDLVTPSTKITGNTLFSDQVNVEHKSWFTIGSDDEQYS
jgi:hypothetical protein